MQNFFPHRISLPKRVFIALMIPVILALGCQGRPFEKPPIHPNPNMDSQNRYNPQSASDFFADGMTMRMPVPGTVAEGELRDEPAFFRGVDDQGELIRNNPLDLTTGLLSRGQARYSIFCEPCHSRVGDGKGIITQYRYPIPPTSFHSDLIREKPDGYIFDVITNGVRNMPSYKHQIPVSDRWAIVAYVRALQKSQNARLSDIPEDKRQELNR